MKNLSLINLVLDNLKNLLFSDNFFIIDSKLSKTEMGALMLIRKNGEIIMSKVSDYISVPMSTATGIADRLEKNGYIKRERSQSDRRIVILVLTDEGRRLTDETMKLADNFIEELTSRLTSNEKQTLFTLVTKMLSSEEDNTRKEDNNKASEIKTISID